MLPHQDEFHLDFAHVFLLGNATDRVLNPKKWVELNEPKPESPRILWYDSPLLFAVLVLLCCVVWCLCLCLCVSTR